MARRRPSAPFIARKLLADTLERIGEGGRDAFYTGPVAEDMVDYLRELGGPHTLSDCAEARGEYVAPIRTSLSRA
jgi:gamma-glutamyltranspeptidase/glutathione hydrolase